MILLVGMLLYSIPTALLGQENHQIQGQIQDVEGAFLPSATTNGVTETRINLLGRFVILSLSYKRNKMGGQKNPMDGKIFFD